MMKRPPSNTRGKNQVHIYLYTTHQQNYTKQLIVAELKLFLLSLLTLTFSFFDMNISPTTFPGFFLYISSMTICLDFHRAPFRHRSKESAKQKKVKKIGDQTQ
jgi:fatty-acid desaturase